LLFIFSPLVKTNRHGFLPKIISVFIITFSWIGIIIY
jgi:hypothetical protein